MNKRLKKKKNREKNKILVEKYPFLRPTDWSGNLIKNYNYDYTFLDDMPIGWKKAFGELLCEDIMNVLIKTNSVNDYSLCQVKEKYGTLRWYDNGAPSELHTIISNYEHISAYTCIHCGKINVAILDDGWISPECKSCFNGRISKMSKYRNVKPYESYIVQEPSLALKYKMRIFDKDGDRIEIRDCTNILKRMHFDISKLPEIIEQKEED